MSRLRRSKISWLVGAGIVAVIAVVIWRVMTPNVILGKLAKAVDVAETAIEEKVDADKELIEKTRAATIAATQAAADRDTVAKLRQAGAAEAATEAEEKAQAAQAAAEKAEQERLNSEELAAEAGKKADDALAAAKQALSTAEKARQQSKLNGGLPPWSFKLAGYLLVALLLSSLFPLSAVGFRRLEVPDLLDQVKRDCNLLGRPLVAPAASTDPAIDVAVPGTQSPARSSITRPRNQCEIERLDSRWSWLSYLIHYSFAIFAIFMGVALFFWQHDTLWDDNTRRAMQVGFLGAYVYCLNLVYRRYTTLDLQPHVYLYCAGGLIAGMVFNFVAFTAITNIASTKPNEEFEGVGSGLAAILAFALGYFPNLAIRWFGRISQDSLQHRQRRSDGLPLSLVDGISELHESRLRDEGIDNLQNLATVDIPELVKKTPFTALEIVEWTDQAVLYLYLDPGEIESFRRAGVRTVSDFQDIWHGFSVRYTVQPDGTVKCIPSVGDEAKADFERRRQSIAQQLATTEPRLDNLYRAIERGPNMEFVRTYLESVQQIAVNARDRLINQISGRVGKAVREGMREGDTLSSDSVLKLAAEQLLVAATRGNYDEAVHVTAESLYGQAFLNSKLERFAEARSLLEECIVQFPNDPVAYNDLAWLDLHTLSTRSAFERARRHAQTAVDLAKKADPSRGDLAPYLDTLALAYCRVKNADSAKESIQEAVDVWEKLRREPDPRFLKTYVEVAQAYLSKDDKTEANAILAYVEDQNYADKETREKIATLRQEHAMEPQ